MALAARPSGAKGWPSTVPEAEASRKQRRHSASVTSTVMDMDTRTRTRRSATLRAAAAVLAAGMTVRGGGAAAEAEIEPTGRRGLSLVSDVLEHLDRVKAGIDRELFLYQTPSFQWIPSSVYRYDDFRASLDVMATDGVAGKTFYAGEDDVDNGHVYGLVNIAAFLAQSMKETIQYDACDENSWDLCGQLGQSYQDYHCKPEEAHMECAVDPDMEIVGVTHAKWYGAPGPMFCGPKTPEQPHSGLWDHLYECNKSWANPPETCDVYEGQKAGRYDQSRPYANTAGRTDVEGCCWWGRGVIQTSGICNFGKLNYFLGAGAANDGRPAKYPNVDFCKDPEIICSSPQHKELKWIAGEFYWIESVQTYDEGGWNYLAELKKFVQGGMADMGFINGVSGIVNRGCHNPPCGTGALDGGSERAGNFKKVLDEFFGNDPPEVGPSPGGPGGPQGSPPIGSGPSPPTPRPTRQPVDPNSDAGGIINSQIFIDMEATLDNAKDDIDDKLFLYQTPAFQWIASSVYRFPDFMDSLYVMAAEGVAGKRFYIGENEVENGHVYGLVNIAAFLAQSMKETIQYDACDENSWDLCGQLGQSYQDYHCKPEEAHMECPVDPDMEIVGVTHAKWYGAPGPMFCGPKTVEQPYSGFWDHLYECNKSWANPPETCDDYEGQKAGQYDQSRPYANTAGRTDVEGCCWWGRGVIQTSGVCNFGKLNYFLGAGAANDGRPAKYPNVDFCKDPEIICSSPEYKELKWIAGEFYWVESVQTYDEGGWNFLAELKKFVDGGMTDTGFINGVSGIVNRGCHNPPCGTGALDGGSERAGNFRKALDVLFPDSPPPVGPSTGGTPGSPAGSGPSTSPGANARWYPDYNSQYALGKCLNDAPVPSGRPNYDTGLQCCNAAYAGQSSGACLKKCVNDAPVPSGRPNYDTGLQCCNAAYAGQSSGACLKALPGGASPPSGPDSPTDSGPSPPAPNPPADNPAEERWYPNYDPQYALGKCVNDAPVPSGRPNYDTGLQCCNAAYAGQSSGACLKALPGGASPPNGPGTPTDSGPSPPTPPPTRQPVDPNSDAGQVINSEVFINLKQTLESAKGDIDDKLFLYQTPAYQWIPSSVYRYPDFMDSLYVMAAEGVAGKRFYIGENEVANGHVYGLVNIAAFLAQSMKETIQYDACDENSWDLCGQLGQSYQDYHCKPEEAHMECPVDSDMSIVAVTHAKWYGAPGPMFCGPKAAEQPHSGFWDHLYECNKSWANPPETCDAYEGQKAGRYDHSMPYANAAGRTDVEGCCWWGRGVIQTSGVCNFGKLNYFLGAGAANDGRPAKYPSVDFCKDPEVICASSEYKELKWIAGEFYWIESVQTYDEGGWNYIAELKKFVQGGMTDAGFINGVSGIVNRGCHNPPCGTGAVDGGWERAENFKKVGTKHFLRMSLASGAYETSSIVFPSPHRKVLEVFFANSPPQVGSFPSGAPGDESPGASDRWYPNYDPQYALGKCINDAPVPSGRLTYDTGSQCCSMAYAGQASGHCLSSLPASEWEPTIDSGIAQVYVAESFASTSVTSS
ncbi:hypothetical protein ACHAWF_012292 [Thalassiosira exigua]